MVEDGAFSHKIDYVTILNRQGHPNSINGSKVTAILPNRWILPIGGASTVKGLRFCVCGLRSRLVFYFRLLGAPGGADWVSDGLFILYFSIWSRHDLGVPLANCDNMCTWCSKGNKYTQADFACSWSMWLVYIHTYLTLSTFTSCLRKLVRP